MFCVELSKLKFYVAEVLFTLDQTKSADSFHLPAIYQKFNKTATENNISAVVDSIRFQMCPVKTLPSVAIKAQLTSERSWMLGLDQTGNYVFVFNRPSPERQLVMHPDFSFGRLFLQEAKSLEKHFPLNTLDIVVFSNWLANRGELLLHASGITFNGKGYAFVGRSGAGKSTLASKLASRQDVTILGEDQVALRYQNGSFWIYGTPWHINSNRCSPDGVPLEKFFFLDRYSDKVIIPLTPQDGFKRLMQTAFIPFYRPIQVSLIMANLERLCSTIPAYQLAFRLGDDILKQIIDL